jgi:multidrug efflux pump subunit AcrA (membrane-fusion protein)
MWSRRLAASGRDRQGAGRNPVALAGRVEKIHVESGQTVKVGQPLVTFADGGA